MNDDNGLAGKLDQAVELLTKTSTKLDGTNERLDDFACRMDRMDTQRELDRNEASNTRSQIAGIAATCQLHAERTNNAECTALEAAKQAAAANQKATAVESSWNDMRRQIQRPGSAEHQKVDAALIQRQQAKEETAADLERRVATAAASAVTQALAVRDEAKKRAQEEQAEVERQVLAKQLQEEQKTARQRKIRQATITWAIRSAIAIVTALGATGLFTLWQQARTNQDMTAKTLERARVLHVQEVKRIKPDANMTGSE